ncbi:MAG: hypothetical protein V3U98_10955 [Acidobacteriota bacterium]
MSDRFAGTRLSAAVIATALAAALAGVALAQQGEPSQQFIIYTQYNPTFVPGKSRVHFTVTAYVQNATRTDLKNVHFRRSFPEGFEVKPIADVFQAIVRRPPEFRQAIEDGDYTMFLPELWGGRGVSIFYELHFSGRPDQVLLPGLGVTFDLEEESRSLTTSADLVQFKPYSFFSGSLRDFLKRNAEVSMSIGLKGDAWRLAPVDSRATGRNPAGITGISGDLDKGHFRLQAGLPGNFRDLVVVWWPARKKTRIQQEEEFLKKIKEYSTWVGLRHLVQDSITIEAKHKFKKFRGWYAKGIWRDDVPERYGEGPFSAALTFSSVADAEYLLFWWVQGRGMGLGRSDVPQPERDATLMHELDAIVNSFRSFRKLK